jgi:cystathionine beta-lyase/cystathionine gamma-synthase
MFIKNSLRQVHERLKFTGMEKCLNPGLPKRIAAGAGGGQHCKRQIWRGRVVAELEKTFAAITGKEKAIYMLSGTMANQLAIAVLSGENSKVFVQEASHIYRDEADAAQSVFQKRLMPLAKGAAYFTAQQLQNAIDVMKEEEVFKTGIGAVSIENPGCEPMGEWCPWKKYAR